MGVEVRERGVSDRGTGKLVGRFDRFLKRSGDALVDRFGEKTAAMMREEMLEEYRRLVAEVPDIGGRRNIYARDLVQSGGGRWRRTGWSSRTVGPWRTPASCYTGWSAQTWSGLPGCCCRPPTPAPPTS
ncbi:MAG: hypothetical protein R6X29_04275 [Acidimicrobiia bacterium]